MSQTQVQPAARQWLEAGRLMGVPFAVLGLEATTGPAIPEADAAASESVAVPVATAARPSPPAAAPAPAADPRSDLPEDPTAALAELAARYEQQVAAGIAEPRFTRVVFGEGDPRASLMVVGEAPGAEDDRSGRPFTGPDGRKLDQMLGAIGLERSAVYMTNVLKIRPTEDRAPQPHELERCGPWLAAQIRLVRPRVILALGAPAARWLLGTGQDISRLRGVWGEWSDDAAGDAPRRIAVLPTFHPTYLLTHYTREVREQMWHDLQAVAGRLGSLDP